MKYNSNNSLDILYTFTLVLASYKLLNPAIILLSILTHKPRKWNSLTSFFFVQFIKIIND